MNTEPTSRRYVRIIDGLSVTVLMLAAVAAVWWGIENLTSADSVELPTAEGPPAVARAEFAELAQSGHRIGPANPAVVAVVFSDYGCGFCAELHETLRILRRRYPHHFGVSVKHFVHPQAVGSYSVALGAECAAEQNGFAAYDEAAYSNNDLINYSDGAARIARIAGIPDFDRFDNCLATQRHDPVLIRDRSDGESLGVRYTPTLVINGYVVVGAQDLRDLDSLIAQQFPGR